MSASDLNRHFAGRDPVVRKIYDRIVRAAESFGPVRQEPKKTSIHLSRQSAFAGVMTRKDGLVLTIKSPRDIKSRRIVKRQHTSANRWHLDVRLHAPAQVDKELIAWLLQSIELSRPPLWTCPKCGAKLLTRNLWHSSGRATLKDWTSRMGPRAVELFRRFDQMIAACGPYHIAPAKTRIAFLGRVRFAGITSLSEDGMTCAFALPAPLSSSRFVKVEEVVPGWWVHRLRVTSVEQLDDEVQRWLRASYRLMGMQERLAANRR